MATPIVPQKRCTKCGNEYPATDEWFKPDSRYTGSLKTWCRSCERAYRKSYNQRPDVRAKKADPAYREQRRLHMKEYNRRSDVRARDLERTRKPEAQQQRREYQREYRQRPTTKLKLRAYYSRPDVLASKRQWWHDHPERRRAKEMRRIGLERGLPCDWTTADWLYALEYWEGRCCICGSSAGFWLTLAQEHWIPLRDERPDNPGTVPWNMLPMCHSKPGGFGGCNNTKSDKDPAIWLIERLGERKAKQKLREIEAFFATVMSNTPGLDAP